MTNDRVTLRRLINAPSYAALWSYSLARTQPLVWRFLNRSGRAMLERHRPSLDGYQQALVDGLSTDGVAVTHFDDLFSDQQELAGLVTLVERLKRKTTVPHTNVCTIQPQQVGRAVGRGCGCARAR